MTVLTLWLKSTVIFTGRALGLMVHRVKGTGTFALDTSSGVRAFETKLPIGTTGVNVPSAPLCIGTAMTR